MPDTTNPEDRTYTLNSETSNYSKDNVLLNIILPTEDPSNTYQFTVYDVSQVTNGETYNGFFVFMRKTTDSGDDLSTYEEDKYEFAYNFNTSEKIQLYDQAGYTPFQGNNGLLQSFVIIYHDNCDDASEKLSCAITAFNNIPSLFNDLVTNGNCIQTMELIAGKPKKLGMSFIPRK